MSKKPLKSILLLSTTAMIVVVLLSLTLPNLSISSKSINESVIKNAAVTIELAQQKVSTYIDAPAEIVMTAEHYLEVQKADRLTTEKFFRALTQNHPEYTLLYWAGEVSCKDGGRLWSDLHWNPPVDFDQWTREWFTGAKASSSYFVSQPYVDANTGRLVSGISKKVITDGEDDGVIAMDMEIDALTKEVNGLSLTKSGSSFIIRKDGIYMTHSDSSKINKDNFFREYGFDASKVIPKDGETYISLDANKQNYLAVRKISDETGWYFVSVGPKDEIEQTSRKLVSVSLIISIISLIIGILFAVITANIISKPMKLVAESIAEIASGEADLTKRIEINTVTLEVSYVIDGFNSFVGKLLSIIRNVSNSEKDMIVAKDSLTCCVQDTTTAITEILENIDSVGSQVNNQSDFVEQTSSAVTQIAENINSLEGLIENQSSGVTQASAAVEQMIGNINAVNTSVDKMADSFRDLDAKSNQGMEYQNTVSRQVSQIAEQSMSLQNANAAIEAIAEQTNLLAMNAAIEAAHAGEAGKGFSVVADEIRKLSENSTEQSKKIGDELTKVLETIQSVVSASQISSKNFQEVNDSITATDIIVQQIKAAMEEQTSGSQQILQALKMMNDSTAEVKAASMEMAEGNKLILRDVQDLQNATMVIKQSMQEMSVGAKEINATGAQLDDISRQVADSVDTIGKEVNQFKI